MPFGYWDRGYVGWHAAVGACATTLGVCLKDGNLKDKENVTTELLQQQTLGLLPYLRLTHSTNLKRTHSANSGLPDLPNASQKPGASYHSPVPTDNNNPS